MGKQSSGTVVQSTLKSGVTTVYGQFKSDGAIGPQDIGGTDKTVSADGNNIGIKGVRCVATGVYNITLDSWVGVSQFLGSSGFCQFQSSATSAVGPRYFRTLVEKLANAPLGEAAVTGIGSLATGIINSNPWSKITLSVGDKVQRFVPQAAEVNVVNPVDVTKGIIGVINTSTLTVGSEVRKLVGGVLTGPTYYVVAVNSANTKVTLSNVPGGAPIDITGVFVVTDILNSTTNLVGTGAEFYVIAVNATGNSITLSATEGGAFADLTGLFAVGNTVRALVPTTDPSVQMICQNITGGQISIPSGALMQFTLNVATSKAF